MLGRQLDAGQAVRCWAGGIRWAGSFFVCSFLLHFGQNWSYGEADIEG